MTALSAQPPPSQTLTSTGSGGDLSMLASSSTSASSLQTGSVTAGNVHQPNVLWRRNEQLTKWLTSETNKECGDGPCRNPARVNFQQPCVFMAACASEDLEEVTRLLNAGVDVNTVNSDGMTALLQACIDGNLDMVRFLVSHGADINYEDNEGWTPLHAAASCGDLDIVKYLVSVGANLSACTYDGELVIDTAEDEPVSEYLKSVIEKRGIDIEQARQLEHDTMLADAKRWASLSTKWAERAHPQTGATAVHVAASKGYMDVLKILVDDLPSRRRPLNLDARDYDGWTPLHAAVHWNQKECAEMLVRAGASMDIRNYNGHTVWDLCDDEMETFLRKVKKTVDEDRRSDMVEVKTGRQFVRDVTTPLKQQFDSMESGDGAAYSKRRSSQESVNEKVTNGQRKYSQLHQSLKDIEQRYKQEDNRASDSGDAMSGSNNRAVTSGDFVASRRSRFESAAAGIQQQQRATVSSRRFGGDTSAILEPSAQSATISRPLRSTTKASSPGRLMAEVTAVTVSSPPPLTVTANVSVSSTSSSNAGGSTSAKSQTSSVWNPSQSSRQTRVPEEAEAERKRKSAKARRERRATQGVTKEDILAAEQQIMDQQQQQQQQQEVVVTRRSSDVDTNKLQRFIEQQRRVSTDDNGKDETKVPSGSSSSDAALTTLNNGGSTKRRPRAHRRPTGRIYWNEETNEVEVRPVAPPDKRESPEPSTDTRRLDQYKQDIDDLHSKCQRLERQNTELQSSISTLKREVCERDQTIDRLKTTSTRSDFDRRKLECLKTENVRLKEENAALIRVISKLSK